MHISRQLNNNTDMSRVNGLSEAAQIAQFVYQQCRTRLKINPVHSVAAVG